VGLRGADPADLVEKWLEQPVMRVRVPGRENGGAVSVDPACLDVCRGAGCMAGPCRYRLSNSRYRFGAYALLKDLVRQAEKERTGNFQASCVFRDAVGGDPATPITCERRSGGSRL
jgi:hypothetical protein